MDNFYSYNRKDLMSKVKTLKTILEEKLHYNLMFIEDEPSVFIKSISDNRYLGNKNDTDKWFCMRISFQGTIPPSVPAVEIYSNYRDLETELQAMPEVIEINSIVNTVRTEHAFLLKMGVK